MIKIMEADTKKCSAKRKAALIIEINQCKTSILEASRSFDILPSEIEE